MNWKQPIPTKIEGLNPFETLVFQAILLRCSNSKTQVKVADDNTYIELERGQCVIGRFEFAKQFGFSKSESLRVYRIVKKLEKVNNLLNNQKSKNCSILTVINYDEWVSFEQSNEQTVNNQRTNREQTVNTNKNDKSGKTAKNVKKSPEQKCSLPPNKNVRFLIYGENRIEKKEESRENSSNFLEKILFRFPEFSGMPHLASIIQAIEDKPKQEQMPYFDWVLANKAKDPSKLLKDQAWRDWFWKDYKQEVFSKNHTPETTKTNLGTLVMSQWEGETIAEFEARIQEKEEEGYTPKPIYFAKSPPENNEVKALIAQYKKKIKSKSFSNF